MKKYILTFLFFVVLLLGHLIYESPVYGQSYQTFQEDLEWIIERARLRLGPFRIYPRINLRNIGYDDNIYRMHREDEDAISDYTATISPEFTAYFLFRDWLIFSLEENPEYVYYAREGRERSLNNRISPQLKILLLRRFVLSGRYTYRKAKRRATSEFDARAWVITNTYRASLLYETARRSSIGFSGSILKLNYEDFIQPGIETSLSRALNRTERNGNFEFYYRIFSESFLYVNAGYSDFSFEHPESRWRNAYSYQVKAGIQLPLLGRIRGNFSVGYKRLQPNRGRKKGFSGIIGDATVNYRIGRLALRLLYSRDSQFSYYNNNVFFFENQYGLGSSFYVTQRIRLDYDLSYGTSLYPELVTTRMPDESYQDVKREDEYLNHSAGLALRIIRNTGIGLRFRYWKRDSLIRWAVRDSWFLGGYITFEFY
jgi:hypothetical protein